MPNHKMVGWRSAWRIYPYKSLFKSLWRPFLLEILSCLLISGSSVSTIDILEYVCSFVNGGYPSIVGFVLSGYALLIGFSNSELIQMLSKRKNNGEPTLFQKVNATFSIMLLMLVLTLVVSLVLSMIIHAKVSVCLFFEGNVEIINKIVLYLFLFMVYYSLLSLLDVVMNIFNFGQFAFVVNDIKNRNKQQEGQAKEIKYPWFLRLWLYILKLIRK